MNVSAMEDNGSSVLACNFDSSNDMLDTSHASNQNCSDPESSDIFHSSDVSQMNDSVSMNSEAQEVMFDDAQSTDFVYTPDGLSIFYTNADNLLNKHDELKVRIQLRPFDVLVITEMYPKTGSSNDISDTELHIDGYCLYRSNIEDHSRGLVIYRNNLKYWDR